MKYWYLLTILATIPEISKAYISTESVKKETPHDIALYVYGPQGLNVPVSEFNAIDSLLNTISQATVTEKINTIRLVLASLTKTLQETNAYIQKAYNQEQVIPLAVFFKVYVLNHQIAYLQKLHEKFSSQQGFFFKIYTAGQNFISWLTGFFTGQKQIQSPEQLLAEQILGYIAYERENILGDYRKQLSFFTSIQKVPLPDIINFWEPQDIQLELYKRAQHIQEQVVPQFGIDTIVDFAIQGVLMAGGSMAIQWVDQNDQATYETYEKKQNQIQQEWSTFITTIQNQSQQIMSNVLDNFKNSLNDVQKKYSASNQLLQSEIQYLMRSLNLAQPKQLFLVAPTNYDIAFEGAAMTTPAPHVWYNVAQKGDWEFDPKLNGFWQNGLQLFGIPAWKTNPATSKPGLDVPEFNSIFTESIINSAAYDIEVECTIYTTSGSPFFAGVMFNKARWISGDPERLTGYRLAGIYGSEKTVDETSKISLDAVFAQQQIIPAQGNSKEQILSPLQIIDTQQTSHFASDILAQDDLKKLNVDPMTFVFQITTKPDSVTCTVLKKEINTSGKSSLTQLAQQTLQNLNTYVFLYHGIGFMAPGCQASFKITKPIQLVYTKKEIQAHQSRKKL